MDELKKLLENAGLNESFRTPMDVDRDATDKWSGSNKVGGTAEATAQMSQWGAGITKMIGLMKKHGIDETAITLTIDSAIEKAGGLEGYTPIGGNKFIQRDGGTH